jgi:hypothetical protein
VKNEKILVPSNGLEIDGTEGMMRAAKGPLQGCDI